MLARTSTAIPWFVIDWTINAEVLGACRGTTRGPPECGPVIAPGLTRQAPPCEQLRRAHSVVYTR